MVSWFIAAALILIMELFIGTIYLMVVSAALFGAGFAAYLFDDLSISIIVAAVLSAVGIWWVKGWIKRHRHSPAHEAALNDLDIGQTVHIVRHLHSDIYEVMYRGTQWQAQAANQTSMLSPQTAVITGKSGNLLLIHLH
jgi:membrane protein implicated in regulation of membrane protease activity